MAGGSPPVRPYLVLAICCSSLLLVTMDSTIVNVALPSIRRDFGARTSGLQWIIDAYTLVVASLLMLSGSLADRFGRRRTFQVGLTTFTLASVLCSLAPSLDTLIMARMLQAVGSSMLNPVAMSIIVNTFTEPKARARAIGMWGATLGISMALGPLVGGALTQSVGWRWCFWINLPIGVLAVILARRFVPESKAAYARRADPIGQALVLTALASLTYGVIEGRHHGWGSPLIVGLFALGASSIVAFLVYEPRIAEPLIDLRFFRSIPFASATVIAVCLFGSFAGFLFLNALYLQEVRGVPAFQTGLFTLPLAIATFICAPISGRLVGSRGARPSLVIAGTLIAFSALALTQLEVTTSLVYLIGIYSIYGIGFGFANAPITNAAVSGMPRARAGLASAIASTSRQVGSSLGVAIAGMLVGASEGGHGEAKSDFTTSMHGFFWIVFGCGIVAVGLGLLSTGALARASVKRVGSLLDEPV